MYLSISPFSLNWKVNIHLHPSTYIPQHSFLEVTEQSLLCLIYLSYLFIFFSSAFISLIMALFHFVCKRASLVSRTNRGNWYAIFYFDVLSKCKSWQFSYNGYAIAANNPWESKMTFANVHVHLGQASPLGELCPGIECMRTIYWFCSYLD